MKRSLLILLFVVVLAGYLGTLIARDPGYVLIAYENYTFQTSLWVLLGLLLGAMAVIYIGLRLTGVLRKVPQTYRGWRNHQKSARAGELTVKGLRLLAEGEYNRARKFLDSGAENSATRAINYLAAARAANDMGENEARETYLRMAEETDAELARARSVVSAELALERGDPDSALGALKNVKPNAYIMQLKASALRAAGKWREMLAAVPEIRKSDVELAAVIEKEAAGLGLSSKSLSDTERHTLFRGLSNELKQTPALLAVYIDGLESRDEVEPLLRSQIKKSWDPELVQMYGDLGEGTLKTRLKTAEGWQKKHSTDSSLQYCLGCIYELNGEASLARECFARSVELGGPVLANRKLGELLAAEGQFERSVEQLRLAMRS